MDFTLDTGSIFFCLLLTLPGVAALDTGLAGIIGSTVAVGLMLVAIIIVCAILCFRNPGPRGPPKPRHRKPPPKYDLNGNAPNGIPLQTRVPNGVMGTPHGTQRSNRSKQLGSHRGAPGPLRFTAAPPGMYRSMMAPHFMYPPYRQIIYIDESDEDEHSVRSTMREHKRRYKRSFFSASRDASSKVEIKEVESGEEQIKFSDEETSNLSPERKRRSRSPEKQNVDSTNSPENMASLRQSTKEESSRLSKESNDEVRQIDDMFSGLSADPTPGDIIFKESGSSSPKQTTPRKYFTEENRNVIEETTGNEYAAVIKPSAAVRESVRSSDGDNAGLYASVVKPTTPAIHDGNRSNPLRQSMSDQLENIIQNRHDGKPTEFDKDYDDEEDREIRNIPEYPNKSYSLSQTERRDISSRKDVLGFSQTAQLSKSSRHYRDERDDFTFGRDYTRDERPVTPPVDIPSEPVSPRESFNRPTRSSVYPTRPETPPFDAVVTPRESTVERPPTPPFDAETDRSTKERKSPFSPETESRGPPDIKAAFSNQVLRELQQRQRGASIGADDDDDDASNSRAVNFSAAPPEIIPRSEPNSPRASMNIPQTGAPPPPPPGMGPPPPPPPPGAPRAPGAPPPPGVISPPSSSNKLPHGMKQKRKYELGVQTKRINWNKVQANKMDKDAFWVNLHEDRFEDPNLFEGLLENFSVATKGKKKEADQQVTEVKKKAKELKILDPKSAQNLSILLGSIKVPFTEIKRRILEVDEDNLNSAIIEQLIRYMPEPEQMKQIAGLKDQYNDLAEPEKFAVEMSSIKRIHPRLKSMLFKMTFPEMVQDIKPDLVAAKEALEEVKTSAKFAKVMELILLVGNILNAGSRNAQSVGFDISFLPKLQNTKSVDGKMTLVHYLAAIVEEKHPDLIQFTEELSYIEKASRVSDEVLQKNLKAMEKSLKQLELDIKNLSKSQTEVDRFSDVMNEFVASAKGQYEVMKGMYKMVDNLYKEMGKYYTFDIKKYALEDFFNDIKAFKELFVQALKDNAKIRETNEKIRRAQEAKERQKKEREAKLARKKALVDMTIDDDQEGVMDNLLEALKTGSCFNVGRDKQGKRKTPRAAGAERRAQLSRSRSRQNLLNMDNSTMMEINFNDSSIDTPPRPPRGKDERREAQELDMRRSLVKRDLNDNEERKRNSCQDENRKRTSRQDSEEKRRGSRVDNTMSEAEKLLARLKDL